MSVLLLPPIFQFFDDNGDPLANGFVYTYAAGTTTPLATFTDYTGTVNAPNPIELDAAGRPSSGSGAIWGEGAYKFIVKDANGVQIGDPLDNVTSFTTLASATNAYFESFSGNSSQTVFTTSSDLGTEEKGLMVFINSGLQEIAVNGTFATDTGWTKGAGWTIGSGVATATGAISTAISQVPTISLVAGQAYAVTYTITRSAGGLIPSLGGQNGTERTASGTYREIIVAASTTPIAFTGNAFTGTLDSVSVTLATSQGYDILSPSAYTINGTSLTFAAAPATGTNNIYVFAPSLLLGAASSAAALAQTYAANALTSQTAAAASAQLAALSIKWRPLVVAATTANITLSGAQTIDGVSVIASNRVLVKNQTNSIENGVYICAAGTWTRSTDADTWSEIVSQAVTVNAGTINNKLSFVNINELGGTLGTDSVNWTQLLVYPAPNSVSTASLDSSGIAPNITSMNGGQLAGFRNRIINGGMQIDQRNAGASQTITAAAALAYTVDRWYGYCTGANVTGQQVNGASYAKKRYRFTGAASVTAIGFGQRIEAANCYDLNSRAATLAVDLANSLLTTVTWTAYYANSEDSFGTLASPTRTQIATGTFTVNSTVTRYYAQIAIPSAATTGIEIVFSVGAQTSGTWTIGDVDLVAGSVNELWHEQRPYGTELVLCQRYYQTIAQLGAVAQSANTMHAFGVLPVVMRAVPTAGQTGVLNAQGAVNTTQSATGLGANFSTASSLFFSAVPNFSGLTAGQPETLANPANNTNVITLSAEL